MTSSCRAAVVMGPGQPPVIETIELAPLADDEVLIRVAAAGICHTDLTWAKGLIGGFPVVLGHECAGRVADVGRAVTSVRPGERVVVASTSHCGHCAACERGQPVFCERRWDGRNRHTLRGEPIHQAFNIGAFAEYTVVRERAVHRLPDDITYEVAAVAGCAVVTGMGAALNVAPVQPGGTVAILGLGGVGACAVLGAALAGAERIVVADPSADRRARALSLGATDALPPDQVALRELAPAGFDQVFEAAGRVDVMRLAVDLLRPGGTAVLMGLSEVSDLVLDANDLVVNQKHVVGCQMGDFRPAVDFDRYFRLDRRGRIDLGALISRTLSFEDIADAMAMTATGDGLRTLVLTDAV